MLKRIAKYVLKGVKNKIREKVIPDVIEFVYHTIGGRYDREVIALIITAAYDRQMEKIIENI